MSEMDLRSDKRKRMGLSEASERIKFLKLLPKAVKYIFTEGLPDRTGVVMALKSLPGAQKRDLYRLGISPEIVIKYTNELRSDREFYSDLSVKIDKAKEIEPKTGGIPAIHTLELIYAMVRDSKPDVAIETGVGTGGVSLFILKALHINGKGRLYSIDLPGFDREFYPSIGKHYDIHVPNGWEPGWLVPSELKSRWTLILGDTKLELPKLLDKVEDIDFFIHDSLHTYEHMMFEYCLAYMYSRNGACLISHDVIPYWSLAFIDFCNAKRLPFAIIDSILGITMIHRQG